MKYFLVVMSLFVFSCSRGLENFPTKTSYPVTRAALSCSQRDVEAAIAAAVDGDTVTIPAGHCEWNSPITISGKGLTLAGAGRDATTIDGGLTLILDDSRYSLVRITGIHFHIVNGARANYESVIFLGNTAPYGQNGRSENGLFRVDNNRFSLEAGMGHGMMSVHDPNYPLGGNFYGLIDHNEFLTIGADITFIQIEGNNNWNRPADFGTKNALYVEDNTFNTSVYSGGISAVDVYSGMKVVIRHNTFYNNRIIFHGADTVTGSVQTYEVYDNQMVASSASNVWAGFTARGGTGFFYNNSYINQGSGTWDPSGARMNLQYYRSDPGCGGHTCLYSVCDGSNSHDNNDTLNGWRCYQQNGVLWSQATSKWITVPTYQWNNTFNGVSQNFAITWPGPGHVMANRDYYDYKAGFDGTTGVGRGTTANRPSTCVPGVGYWSTDESRFYTCSSINSWALSYTPYTYPHPLVQ